METPTKAQLDALITLKDFYAYFEAIPEEEWSTGSFTHRKGPWPAPIVACCSMGHLGYGRLTFPCSSSHVPGSEEAVERLQVLVNNRWPPGFSIIGVNDGTSFRFQQPTPRQRILAMCS